VSRAAFVPYTRKIQLPKDQRQDLEKALDKWRTQKQAARANGRSLMSKRVDMSDAQLQKLADHGADFLRERIVTPDLICKFIEWDLASPDDLRAVADVIMDWRQDAQLASGLSPRGAQAKKPRTTTPQLVGGRTSRQILQPAVISQPSFSPARRGRGHGGVRGRGGGRGGSHTSSQPVRDSDFFGPAPQFIPPRTISTRTTASSTIPPTIPTPPSDISRPTPTLSQPLHSSQNLTYAYQNPYMYATFGSCYPQAYPMYALPPRYYPPTPDQNKQQ
jgi:hypothetical protein